MKQMCILHILYILEYIGYSAINHSFLPRLELSQTRVFSLESVKTRFFLENEELESKKIYFLFSTCFLFFT